MTRPRQARLVHIAVRCYSPKWRERHADEATELAELLMRDGMSAVFIALSYLKAATRDRLVTRPKRRLGPTAAVLLIGATLVGVPLVLLDSFTAANAASSNESFVVVLSGHNAVALGVSVQVTSLQHQGGRRVVLPEPNRRGAGCQG
jgi:ferric-dicitrate binding protein FerR (iron transport regulator)